MARKYTNLEKLRSRALRLALTAFRAEPSLGHKQAQLLFSEILSLVRMGKEDEEIVKELVQKHRTRPAIALTTVSA